jgi:hypothetical protein
MKESNEVPFSEYRLRADVARILGATKNPVKVCDHRTNFLVPCFMTNFFCYKAERDKGTKGKVYKVDKVHKAYKVDKADKADKDKETDGSGCGKVKVD